MLQLSVLQEQVNSCTKCSLRQSTINSALYRGSPEAKLMLTGEALGEEETKQGKPFVGKSGQLVDRALTELGLDVEKDIYVCNIINCRPPNNRKPTDEECDTCFPYWLEQVDIVKPKVIVALGSTAMNNLINTNLGITKMRGKIVKAYGTQVIPVYHPSYVLRSGGVNSENYKLFKQDLQLATQNV